MEKDLLKNDNGKKKELDKSNIQNKILEENDLNNESNSVGSNIKNTEKYSKENWKKLIDIPNIRMGKKFSVNSSTEYSIENKYINGGDLQIIKDNTELKYFKNIEFQGKKFLIFTKKADILKYYRIYYYCKNHRTSKTSEKLDDKGNKVRINLCNAKIKYEITPKKYSMIGNHSEECENLSNSLVTNYAEIKVEINNYQNFKDILKSYLKEYPIITFPEFKKYGQKIYYENKHNFPINNNFYSNIYYNWRKMSNLFNKNSIFENQKTSDGLQFLRDYSLSLLYKKNNKSQLKHEHAIYVSDYFIKKLYKANHFYIDGTFVYPSGFKQLIVILYYDKEKVKRFPNLFALINNKTEEGYYFLFKRILDIITIENTKLLELKSMTLYFEIGLINSLTKVFPNVKKIGCFFHYTRALRKKAKELNLLNNSNKNITLEFLKLLYKAPFIFAKDKNYPNTICEIYLKKYDILENFINYFRTQWFKYYENGMLDYSSLSKYQRSNSYIENYNRRIKLRLSKFLFGKNKCKISWPLFFYFILHEEEDVKKENYNIENSLEIKIIDVNKSDGNELENHIIKDEDIGNYKKKEITESKKENVDDAVPQTNIPMQTIYSRNWLKFKEYSCRHDSFFLLYTFIIYNKTKLEKEDNIIITYNNISQHLLQMDLDDLNGGIWKILEIYKTNSCDLTKYGFKQYYTIMQHVENFVGNQYFCIEYTVIEGCSKSNCVKNIIKKEHFSPSINFNGENLKKYSIENYLDALFANIVSYCIKCQWKNDMPDKSNSPSYYKYFQDIVPPIFIFISFEDNLNDIFENNDVIINENSNDLILYNKIKENLNYIKNILVDSFSFCDKVYNLKGLICQEYAGHYSAILINVNDNSFLIDKGKTYYYNDRKYNNEIRIIENWKEKLNEDIPVLAIYEKE